MFGFIQGPLVSIVIPVYNAEKYLDEALRTLAGQDYRNLEMICVDDGSTDNSKKILQEWKNKDPRIRLLTQDHRGAGAARNHGMGSAKGKYILFLDADDVFRKCMIRELVRQAEKNDTDIIVFRYYKFSGDKKTESDFSAKNLKVPINRVISPVDISDRMFQADHGMPWNKFYKTDFVKGTKVWFQLLSNTNDEFFSRITTVEAGRIMFLGRIYVGYRVGNKDSIQGKVRRNLLDFTEALSAIHDELKARGYYETYYKTYQKLAAIIIMWRLTEREDYDSFRIVADKVCSDTLDRCELDEVYVEEEYKDVYRALRCEGASEAVFELCRTKEKRVLTFGQKIKRRLKRVLCIQ